MVYRRLSRRRGNPLDSATGPALAPSAGMKKIARLFVIKTRFEAMAVIYALAVGAITRGLQYLDRKSVV